MSRYRIGGQGKMRLWANPVATCATASIAPSLIHDFVRTAGVTKWLHLGLINQRGDLGLEAGGMPADETAGQVMAIAIE